MPPRPAAPKTFDEVIQRYQGQLVYCYDKARQDVPTLEGRLVMGWRIEGGLVADTPSAIEDTVGSPVLADCVARKIRRWQFPQEMTGEFSWPFVFRPK
jgi:hypothetical protein